MTTETLHQAVREIAVRLVGRLNAVAVAPEAAEVSAAVDDSLAELSSLRILGEANRLPSAEFWKIAGETLYCGWLQHRARLKPRGYAGDYELLARIVDQQICDHALGRLFDLYFLGQAAPVAVRSRTQLAAAAMVAELSNARGAVRIVSVGSGPGRDFLAAVNSLAADDRRRLQIVLIDVDPAALDFAAESLRPFISSDQITAVRENLFRLPRSRHGAEILGVPQLLVCTGIFDYLNDVDSAAMAAFFYRELAPAGRALIFNFAPRNPTRAYMEWIANWYLVYRDDAQMTSLAGAAGFPVGSWALRADETGINPCLDVRKSRRA